MIYGRGNLSRIFRHIDKHPYICVDGIPRKHGLIGYCWCNAHRGFLTSKLLDEHECLKKQCRFLDKYEDAEYWIKRAKAKKRREDRKAQKIDFSNMEKLAFESAVELTDGMECKIIRAQMMKGGLIKISFVSYRYIDFTKVVEELRQILQCGVYMRRIKMSKEETTQILDLRPDGTPKNIELEEIYNARLNNQPEIIISEQCGCYNCCRIFPANEITEYKNGIFGTAICPYCKKTTVLPDSGYYELTEELLKCMKEYWQP